MSFTRFINFCNRGHFTLLYSGVLVRVPPQLRRGEGRALLLLGSCMLVAVGCCPRTGRRGLGRSSCEGDPRSGDRTRGFPGRLGASGVTGRARGVAGARRALARSGSNFRRRAIWLDLARSGARRARSPGGGRSLRYPLGEARLPLALPVEQAFARRPAVGRLLSVTLGDKLRREGVPVELDRA